MVIILMKFQNRKTSREKIYKDGLSKEQKEN